MMYDLLGRVTAEDKAAVFDELVRTFQGKWRFVGNRRKTEEVKTGPHGMEIIFKDYPVYEFVLRVDGHNDFAAALLTLLKRPNGLNC